MVDQQKILSVKMGTSKKMIDRQMQMGMGKNISRECVHL
jgi:hypothetical protein